MADLDLDPARGTPVRTVEELERLVGTPEPRVATKVRSALHPMDRAFVAASPFWAMATADRQGRCDVSPKGDPAGAVLVLDEQTLVLPERPGNRRVDGFRNLLGNPGVGLMFLVPGRGDTLRVNGRGTLVRDAPLLDELVVRGHRPRLAVVVDVEEVFYHCSKAFLRSALWDPATWDPDAVPSRARIAHAIERADQSWEEVAAHYGAGYAAQLYTEP